jgi:hypothetical protein
MDMISAPGQGYHIPWIGLGHLQSGLTIPGRLPAACDLAVPPKAKYADVGEHFEMSPHVGLLFSEPPGSARLSFTKSSDDFHRCLYVSGRGIQVPAHSDPCSEDGPALRIRMRVVRTLTKVRRRNGEGTMTTTYTHINDLDKEV